MRLNELGLRPATLACLLDTGIHTLYELLDRSCRELVWHREIIAAQLHETLYRLNHHHLALPPRTKYEPRLPASATSRSSACASSTDSPSERPTNEPASAPSASGKSSPSTSASSVSHPPPKAEVQTLETHLDLTASSKGR